MLVEEIGFESHPLMVGNSQEVSIKVKEEEDDLEIPLTKKMVVVLRKNNVCIRPIAVKGKAANGGSTTTEKE